ncbi:hypothetical protein BACPEC_00755 [[Bacteroides] pectinophilus ATCC 43243]|uniref:Uncharacterized protein n=1 Tax=[Bacteroides] pectinophilus ATCC 43243 TaxID=483218 RepID=B7AQ00_9FIRM|nr:hypothetical protein BACPEC_00755 [[Bacteroides] pectinophilus ATCC 43243]
MPISILQAQRAIRRYCPTPDIFYAYSETKNTGRTTPLQHCSLCHIFC